MAKSEEINKNLSQKKSDKEKPLVSIVIPTYNRANMISKAIAACMDQTYKNIEVILLVLLSPGQHFLRMLLQPVRKLLHRLRLSLCC